MDTLYGRLAHIANPKFSGLAYFVYRSSMFMFRALSSIITRLSGYTSCISFSMPMARESNSMAITFLAPRASNARVRPAGPEPTSTTTELVMLGTWLAILSVRFRSRMKFWPRDFLAFRLYLSMKSETGGRLS